MAARSASGAARAFVDPLQQSLSCVTKSVLVQRFDGPARSLSIFLPGQYLPVRGRQRLELSILREAAVLPSDHRTASWTARSLGYWYQVRRSDGPEVIAFHWHPAGLGGGIPFPHLHLGRAVGAIDIDAKAYVPTGRVSLEAVVAFLIRELGVRPLRSDWETILAANQAAFDAKRTW